MNLTNTTYFNGTKTPSSSSETTKLIKVVMYSLFILIGTIGNTLVIVILRDKKRRTVNDYFIFNLAASDLIFILLTHPIFLYELFEPVPRNAFYCKGIWPLMSISLFVSIFTMTCMALERCRAILHPFRTRTNPKNVIILLVCVWTGSVVSVLPLILVAEPSNQNLCNENWPTSDHRRAYTAALFVLQYGIPLFIILVAYIRIAFHITHTRVPRTSINQRGQLVRNQAKTENIQIIKSLAAIVLLFAICMLPNQIAWMIMDFGKDEHKHLSALFWEFSEAMIFLHSSLNPIVYGTLTQRFRRGYIRYIKFVICCCRSSMLDSSITDQSYDDVDVKTRGSIKPICLLNLKRGNTNPRNASTHGTRSNGVPLAAIVVQTSLSVRELNRIQPTEAFGRKYPENKNVNTDKSMVTNDLPSGSETLLSGSRAKSVTCFGSFPRNVSPTASTSNLIEVSPVEKRRVRLFSPTEKKAKSLSNDFTCLALEADDFQGNVYNYINPGMENDNEENWVQDTKL